MADESMSIWKIVGAIVALFVVVLIAALLTKGAIINEYLGMAFFIFTFFVIFAWLFFSFIISMKKNRQVEDTPKSGIDAYMRQINTILESRPGGETIQWEGGKYTRYVTKTLYDINRQANKFIGVVGMLTDSDKRVVLIYSANDKDIVRFYGDPGPDLISDPFYDFRPFDVSTRNYSPFPSDYYDKRRSRAGVNINLGGKENDRNWEDDFGSGGLSELDRLKR
jgi:hypothetical protein